jgi:hypothetical protein
LGRFDNVANQSLELCPVTWANAIGLSLIDELR